ncbi:hypothetical protein OESDEN_04412 [Oesophagostomum dentatum]|uniref:Uncharacterized protein n=1 Tax=Oesophagostomum dentatum TaxID=61180 RepID=A0A0B1TEI3_OESDE|nr:hypothetical protein OESDEN_04412 [Oesophagostomum dentatum]
MPMARSRTVKNLFELGCVASTALHDQWKDKVKEHMLLDPMGYMTPSGLARAINAHARVCYKFRQALEDKKGVELEHPEIFGTTPGYNAAPRQCSIALRYRQAMAMRHKVEKDDGDDEPGNPTIITLPHSFGRVLKDVNEPESVKFIVYVDFDDMANQLDEQRISGAIVWVWPNALPNSDQIDHVVVALRKHLQYGGVLELVPPPFELSREENWSSIGKKIDLKHAGISLGICPRKGEDRFLAWQVVVFLQQVAHTVSRSITLPPFSLARKPSKEKPCEKPSTSKEVPAAQEKDRKRKRDVFYIKDVKQKRKKYEHLMKQTGHYHSKHRHTRVKNTYTDASSMRRKDYHWLKFS